VVTAGRVTGGSGAPEPPVTGAVFLCGLLFFDVVFTGLQQPPAPGVEVWTTGVGSGPGGIATFALALSRLGLRTSLAAAFGEDPHGEVCWRTLADSGVDLSSSRRFPGWTTPVTASLAYAGDRALVSHLTPPPVGPDELASAAPVARAAVVQLRPEPAAWLDAARVAGSLIFADVGWDATQTWPAALVEQLSGCHAFMPNAGEAMGYTRTDSPAAALSRLSELVPLAVVTCGEQGAIAVDQTTGEQACVPGLPVDVVDPTGAGDVFGSALVYGTLAGWPLADRLRFAGLAAALSLGRPGGGPAAPGWPQLSAWWSRTRDCGHPDLLRDYRFLDHILPAAGAAQVPAAGAPDPTAGAPDPTEGREASRPR
jgi:sugar/nucleoside kinase (ribokinase family)